jgi:hypothetical protein
MNASTPIPLRPDPFALHAKTMRSLTRAAIAVGQAKTSGSRYLADRLANGLWPDDKDAHLIARAATSPHTIASTGALATTVMADVIATLAPTAAGARLLHEGLVVSFGRAATISVPSFEAAAGNASFVAEGQPIPVRQLNSRAVPLAPHKLAVIAVLSEEMFGQSKAEALIGDTLALSIGLALDSALFGAAAASAKQPAGLLNGITASMASAATSGWDAMIADLATLAAAVGQIGGRIAFITAPARAITINLRSFRDPAALILSSSVVPADQVIAVALNGVAAAIEDGPPRIEIARETTLQEDDVPDGSGTLVAPTQSLWQTATVGLSLKFDVTWALRDPRAVAWMQVTGW